ncbi:uncharacterized protein LOC117650875 isoform X3 [Thrips palmi]|uniref:Uncharacterized protein LOC117650875 isoform X3 n=1 Tax=Thrips palmi TaxID=161013 RepID=A0A6P8ZZ68_THRPL|nr:uncharacterized protein LOC117650875 isoform X3 [Thrips palmi]
MTAMRVTVLALLLSASFSSAVAAALKRDTQPVAQLSVLDGAAAGALATRAARSAEEGSEGAEQDELEVAETAKENHLGEGLSGEAEDDGLSNATHVHRPHLGPHVHGHDGKAGCYGYRYPVVIYVTTTTESSDDGQSEQLRSRRPARSRMRMRGRRAAAERLGLGLASTSPSSAAVDQDQGDRDGEAAVQGGQLAAANPLYKSITDVEFNDLDHAKLEALLDDDGTARVRRDTAPDVEDVDVEAVTKSSILDYSIRDLVKRCVDSIVGVARGGGGGGNGAGVTIAKEGISLGRTAIDGGVQVAKMIVQAFRDLGTTSSLVGDVQPLDSVVLDDGASRQRRDAITNIKKNLKTKGEVLMSRGNDVGEKINDRMDNMFGESKLYQKVKEMIMTAMGKAVQTAASAATSSSRRRRDTAGAVEPAQGEAPGIPRGTPRPRKGKEAILARVLADLDNIPGRRIAKLVVSKASKREDVQDGDEERARPEDAEGEAADMLMSKRSRRATPTTTTEASSEEDDDEETSTDDNATREVDERPALSTEAPKRDIGAELGVRRRRDAVLVKRDVAEDVRNITDRIVQRGKEMVAKVKQAIDEVVKKIQAGRAQTPGAAGAAGAAGGAGAAPEAQGKASMPTDMTAPVPQTPQTAPEAAGTTVDKPEPEMPSDNASMEDVEEKPAARRRRDTAALRLGLGRVQWLLGMPNKVLPNKGGSDVAPLATFGPDGKYVPIEEPSEEDDSSAEETSTEDPKYTPSGSLNFVE